MRSQSGPQGLRERPEEFAQRAFATGIVPTAVIPACAPLQVSNPGRLSRKRKLPRWVHDILQGMNDSYIGQLHDPAPGELDLADPLHAFHALVWRRQAKRCWRERLAFLGRALEHPREPRHEFVIQA